MCCLSSQVRWGSKLQDTLDILDITLRTSSGDISTNSVKGSQLTRFSENCETSGLSRSLSKLSQMSLIFFVKNLSNLVSSSFGSSIVGKCVFWLLSSDLKNFFIVSVRQLIGIIRLFGFQNTVIKSFICRYVLIAVFLQASMTPFMFSAVSFAP